MRNLIATTLLPALLAFALATPAAADDLARDLTVEQSTAAQAGIAQAGGLKVAVSTDRQDATYARGEKVRLFVTTNEEAYVTVLNIGPTGQVTQLFPNAFQPDARVAAGRPVEIGGGASGASITVSGPVGRELMKVIASNRPLTVIADSQLHGQGAFRELQGGVPALVRNLEVAANDQAAKGRKLVTSNFVLRTVEARAGGDDPMVVIVPTAAPAAPTPAVGQGFPLLAAVDRQSYRIGETVTLAVTTLQACHLTVLDINAAGAARQLFPNRLMPGNALGANQTVLISGGNAPVALKLDGPAGTEQIVSICTGDPAPLFAPQLNDTATFPLAGDRAGVAKTLTVTAAQGNAAAGTATISFNVQP